MPLREVKGRKRTERDERKSFPGGKKLRNAFTKRRRIAGVKKIIRWFT
jgi:hypothetical protein